MAESKGAKHTTSASRKARYTHYRAMELRERHKLKRVLQSSGRAAAVAYAEQRGLGALLKKMIAVRPVIHKKRV